MRLGGAGNRSRNVSGLQGDMGEKAEEESKTGMTDEQWRKTGRKGVRSS